jgi:hypothetical protein
MEFASAVLSALALGFAAAAWRRLGRLASSNEAALASTQAWLACGLEDEEAESLAEALDAGLNLALAQIKQPCIRFRMLLDLKTDDPFMDEEFIRLQARGDGSWLSTYAERAAANPKISGALFGRIRELNVRGWRLVHMEPAYETTDGLMVSVLLERPLQSVRSAAKAA